MWQDAGRVQEVGWSLLHPARDGLRIRRRGRRAAATATREEAAEVLIDGIGTHDGAFGGLLHVVVEAEVGEVDVRANDLMRVLDAFAQLAGAGFEGVELGVEGAVDVELRHIDKGGDEIRVESHLTVEGLHHAAALRAHGWQAATLGGGEVDEEGQLGLDGGKGRHDVGHVLGADGRADLIVVRHRLVGW